MQRFKLKQGIRQKIAQIACSTLSEPHFSVFLFGSRANCRNPSSRSDFDIGLEAREEIPLAELGALREKLEDLPLLQKIDLVDFKRVSPEFRNFALQNIEMLYEQ